MGRGRQKAKATRQAREMKYFSPGTDLGALERELGIRREDTLTSQETVDTVEDVSEEDEYAEYSQRYAVGDEDGRESR